MATPEARRSIVVEIQSREERDTYPPTLTIPARVRDFEIDRFVGYGKHGKIVHMWARVTGAGEMRTCCREHLVGTKRLPEGAIVNCIYCLLCRGCVACKDGMITDDTIRLGYWVTRNHRKLFPFELDDLHLCNVIRVLKREGDRYKKNWEDWLIVLEAEAKLRGLSW